MTKEEVLSRLCYHDKRHPDYNEEMDNLDKFPGKQNCFCDNCFYGKTEIAEFILSKLDSIETEYGQYQFFLNGYRNGSASISEVTAAHDEFLKAMKL